MNLNEIERALRVCDICRARKKGCDKLLPICGYCRERRLECQYSTLLPSQDTDTTALGSASGASSMSTSARILNVNTHAKAWETISPFPAISIYDFVRTGNGLPLNDRLNNEVICIMQSYGMSIREICEQFFDGFHRWLPIVSPERFWEINLAFQNRSPPADVSVLLLAICLITLRPTDRVQQPNACLKSLYETLRLSFATVQAVVCASTPLIQAGTLLAAYQYACKKPETAYISIGTCARMSSIVGIDRHSTPSDQGQATTEATLRVLDERNVWWGVIIMERLILVEVANRNHLSMTGFPSNEFPLPRNLRYDGPQSFSVTQSSEHRGPTLKSTGIDHFGRQAQAVAILDQILQLLRNAETAMVRRSKLFSLDTQLQALKTQVMNEYQTPGNHCTANATIIRTFFVLHHGILNQRMNTAGEITDGHEDTGSWVALDTAARMMTAVAGHHVEHVANIDILPLCASYNVQVAGEHIATRQEIISENWPAAAESLRSMEEAFRRRWPDPDNV